MFHAKTQQTDFITLNILESHFCIGITLNKTRLFHGGER
jgi:hypothetical protein